MATTTALAKIGSPGMPKDPARLVTDIIGRRNESQKWMRKNLYGEMTEVWQAIKCKTPPIYKKDRSGAETHNEDKSRTNVAMPDLNIIYRRNAARMTAQPYRLRYTGGSDPTVTDALSGLAMQQYARSNEAFHDVRMVLAAEAFGWGYTKLYQDTLTRMMKFRRAIMKGSDVVYRDRASIMRFQGAADDEVDEAVDELGPEMDDDEIADFMSKSGSEVNLPTQVKQYEGPVVKFIFNGDLFLEPNCRTLDQSSYTIEQYVETDLWLKKMSKLNYEDEKTGAPVPAFDPDALQELMSMGGDTDQRDEGDDLRDMFNSSIGREKDPDSSLPFNLRPRRKYRILEQHSQDADDGQIWITYVSEKFRDKPLGRRPYPYDLYGKYLYTDMTPLPDLISAYGDSTPRLLRHLYAMHNLTVAQNFDYITNLLKPFILSRIGVTVEPEVVVRGLFRELKISDLNGIKPLTEPPLPNGAFDREAQIMRMMSIAEPSLTAVDNGTDANPQAGKTATTALLSSKAADALTQFKFDGRNRYLRELGLKKLWMNQQQQHDAAFEIQSSYWNQGTRERVDALGKDEAKQQQMPDWALSDHYDKVVAIRLDPSEIQEDFDCEPEAGSYLAVDDEMRQQAALTLTQVAMANPEIIDKRKVIRFQMSTIRGIGNPDDYFLPQAPPSPPPPKISVNINIPIDKMPADVTNQLLGEIGLQPSQTLVHNDAIKTAVGAGQAGDAADNLLGPGEQEKAEHAAGTQQAQEVSRQAHEHQQRVGQQEHDHVSAIRDHIGAIHQGTIAHVQKLTEADQAHSNTMAEQSQQQAAQAEQQENQLDAQKSQQKTALAATAAAQKQQIASQEKQQQVGLDAAGVKQPGVKGMGKNSGG
jgi:hypothetical protein